LGFPVSCLPDFSPGQFISGAKMVHTQAKSAGF
jgi:hypothetical protein